MNQDELHEDDVAMINDPELQKRIQDSIDHPERSVKRERPIRKADK